MIDFPRPGYIGDVIRMKAVSGVLPDGNGHCLDVGAGCGLAHDVVTRKGYFYDGLDLHPGHPRIRNGDAEFLGREDDNFFDVVLCVDVLEHLMRPDLAVKEAFRVLKPGGLYIIHVPNLGQTHILVEPVEQDDHERKGFSVVELKELLKDFSDVVIKSTFSVPDCIAWELVYSQMHGLSVDPFKLVFFDWKSYNNLGWCVQARKVVSE